MSCDVCHADKGLFFNKRFRLAWCRECRDRLSAKLGRPGELKALFDRRWAGQRTQQRCDICNDRFIRVRSLFLQIDTCLTCANTVQTEIGHTIVFEPVAVHEQKAESCDSGQSKVNRGSTRSSPPPGGKARAPQRSPYEALGIKEGASSKEIVAAYRHMAAMYHPDKVAGLAPEFGEISERRMKEINAAYEALKRSRK